MAGDATGKAAAQPATYKNWRLFCGLLTVVRPAFDCFIDESLVTKVAHSRCEDHVKRQEITELGRSSLYRLAGREMPKAASGLRYDSSPCPRRWPERDTPFR